MASDALDIQTGVGYVFVEKGKSLACLGLGFWWEFGAGFGEALRLDMAQGYFRLARKSASLA